MRSGQTIIERQEIALKLAHPGQAEELFNLLERERGTLEEFVPWVAETQSLPATQRFLRESDLFNQGGQKLISLIYWQGLLAGSIGLLRINRQHRSAEMGYWLGKEAEGRGIMSTAARLLVTYIFEHLPIHRLEIRIPSPNVRAQRIPHVLGFQHEGTLRQGAFHHGQFLDIELYALIRTDWN